MRLLEPLLIGAGSVRVQVGQDPLTQKPHRARIADPGVLEQGGFHRFGVPGSIRSRYCLNDLSNRGGMLGTNVTDR
ncbi:MAG TPA: hypothetical protein VJ851_13260 [Jatrophihabitans sp.]|nr:hypothetical protein [Jatrophihabitans sp.]